MLGTVQVPARDSWVGSIFRHLGMRLMLTRCWLRIPFFVEICCVGLDRREMLLEVVYDTGSG